VRRVEVRWRRWFVEWLAVLLWLGLLPVIVSATYYAVKKAPDFDSVLKSRPHQNTSSAGDILWAVRVGGTSRYKSGMVLHTTNFGVNAEDRKFGQRADQVWNGELLGTYQATYIARLRSALFPTVVCVFRDVEPDGKNSYEVQPHGSGPIRTYILYVGLGSAVVLTILKAANVLAKKNTVTAGPSLSG